MTKRHRSAPRVALAIPLLCVAVAACSGDDPPANNTNNNNTNNNTNNNNTNNNTDTTPPTLEITDDVSGVADGDVNFTFTFSEDVGASFTEDDVMVSGGTAGAFTSVSGTVSTLVVSPPADTTGTIMVSVAAMSFEDAAGNANSAMASAEQAFDTTSTVDTTPPTVAITDDAPGVATRDVTFTFTFSEDIGTSFAAEDITVTGGTAGAFTSVSGTVATLVVNLPSDAMGTLTLEVAAMSFEDAAGNLNATSAVAQQAFDTRVGGPFNGVVFDDDYGAGITFMPFDDSINDVTLDTAQAQSGAASLRIVVPGTSYTGGALVLTPPVDASAFDAVQFWARADQAKALDVAGYGNDAEDTTLNTEIVQLPVSTTWTQYTVPIPKPSALGAQAGLFHFAEGSGTGGYTLWLDEIRYVSLGNLTNPRATFATATEALAVGETAQVGGVSIVIAVGGQDVTLQPAAAAFLDLTSDNPSVATVDAFGEITAVAEGTAVITGSIGGTAAIGMVTVNVGAGCTPTGPNLAVNGDFERGDFSCIQQFANGGTQSISTMNPRAGTYAVNLNVTTPDADTVLKFANMAPGMFSPGDTIYISLEVRGAVNPGGVVFAEFFSELTGGGTSSAEILTGGPLFPNADPGTWTKVTTTAVTGSDTSGGITLQLKAASGAGGLADIFIDNVCVSTTPCP